MTRRPQSFEYVYAVEGGEEMLDAGIAFAGEGEGARARDVLTHPERAHRVGWHALAWFWTRAFWPVPCLGELEPCTGMTVVMSRCSETWWC